MVAVVLLGFRGGSIIYFLTSEVTRVDAMCSSSVLHDFACYLGFRFVIKILRIMSNIRLTLLLILFNYKQ